MTAKSYSEYIELQLTDGLYGGLNKCYVGSNHQISSIKLSDGYVFFYLRQESFDSFNMAVISGASQSSSVRMLEDIANDISGKKPDGMKLMFERFGIGLSKATIGEDIHKISLTAKSIDVSIRQGTFTFDYGYLQDDDKLQLWDSLDKMNYNKSVSIKLI